MMKTQDKRSIGAGKEGDDPVSELEMLKRRIGELENDQKVIGKSPIARRNHKADFEPSGIENLEETDHRFNFVIALGRYGFEFMQAKAQSLWKWVESNQEFSSRKEDPSSSQAHAEIVPVKENR